jgi:hypothetical protein
MTRQPVSEVPRSGLFGQAPPAGESPVGVAGAQEPPVAAMRGVTGVLSGRAGGVPVAGTAAGGPVVGETAAGGLVLPGGAAAAGAAEAAELTTVLDGDDGRNV